MTPGTTAEVTLDMTGTLTAKEQALFELLTRNRGRLYSRSEILERVWGLDFEGDERIVDAYVKRIRRKISEDAIETVRGVGYRRPSVPDQRQSLPHFRHLSADARTILELGRRVLHVSTVGGVLLEVEAVLSESLKVCGVALLTALADADQPGGWEVQSACGDETLRWLELPPLRSPHPEYPQVLWDTRSGTAAHTVALLPLAGSEQAWGTLAVASAPGSLWDAGVYAQLEAVAALVNPALRLIMEMNLRQQAERELRDLNARLEYGVQQRTQHLLQAKQHATLLNTLFKQMEQASSVPELLQLSLPVLAGLAGMQACAAWLSDSALAAYRADGTFCAAPRLPRVDDSGVSSQGVLLCSEVGGERFLVHAFQEPDAALSFALHSREVSPLLESAVQALALMLSRQVQLAALERAALTDETTGVGNRQAFLTDLWGEAAYSVRHAAGFALVFIEIMNIRFLNATLGYAGGNDAIRQLAQTLARAGRLEDRVYRVSGATFAAVLRFPAGTGQPQALEGWRARLQSALAELLQGAPFMLDLRVSEVLCPEDARQPSDLWHLALERLGPLNWGERTTPGAVKTSQDAQDVYG